jgi:hypothetical protein
MPSPRVAYLLVAVLLLFSGCDRAKRDAADAAIDTRNPLEIAARERGVVRADASDRTSLGAMRCALSLRAPGSGALR